MQHGQGVIADVPCLHRSRVKARCAPYWPLVLRTLRCTNTSVAKGSRTNADPRFLRRGDSTSLSIIGFVAKYGQVVEPLTDESAVMHAQTLRFTITVVGERPALPKSKFPYIGTGERNT